MTDQHPSFGGVAVADPRTTTSPLDLGAEGAPDDNRRKLALVGAVVAVVVVLIAAFFMLKSKGGSSDNAALPPHIVPPAASGQASSGTTGTASAPKPIKLPKPFAGVVGRDPFKPLYVPPAPKSSTPPTGAASNPVAVTPAPPVASTGGSTSTTPSTGGNTSAAGGVPAGYVPVWVELVHVTGTKSATFVVDYTNGKKSTTVTYSAAAPTNSARTVFGRVFSLLSIQNGTATVQMGDGTPFDLAKGFSNRHFLG